MYEKSARAKKNMCWSELEIQRPLILRPLKSAMIASFNDSDPFCCKPATFLNTEQHIHSLYL
jgi:hypothetical protein